MENNDNIIYNKFCSAKECKHYIEWVFSANNGEYLCVSCMLVGQSHNITEYPKECPFINDIKNYKKELLDG